MSTAPATTQRIPIKRDDIGLYRFEPWVAHATIATAGSVSPKMPRPAKYRKFPWTPHRTHRSVVRCNREEPVMPLDPDPADRQ